MVNSTFQIPVVALDIGYFSVKGASRREKNDTIKAFQFPSQCSHVSSMHKTSMGMAALSGANVTVNGSEYFVGQDVVLQTSARQTRAITENYADSPEYKALFLGGLYYILRDYAGELRGKDEVEIRRMVAGLPMNTLGTHEAKVRELFEGTHVVPSPFGDGTFKVHIKSVNVIPQPQGAMVSTGARQKTMNLDRFFDQNMLVLDMGGGTFDWFLVTKRKILHNRSGAYQKGVLTCVNMVCDRIKPGIKDDPLVVERVDEAIREGYEEITLGGKKYRMDDYLPIADAVLTECLNSMRNAVLSLESIDLIIFTGGGGKRLHHVAQKLMPDLAGIMALDTDPVFSNVRGFYVLGEASNG